MPETKKLASAWNRQQLALFHKALKNDEALLVGGLHLTGSSSQNTTLLLAELKREQIAKGNLAIMLTIKGIYNKLGSSATTTANDSLHALLSEFTQIRGVFTDAPCEVPPCLSCKLEVCPGTAACPDPQTAKMQAMWGLQKSPRGRKKEPLDPSRLRMQDFRLAEKSGQKPRASIHAGNYVSAIRMQQLGRMEFFKSKVSPAELPFEFFRRLYVAQGLPGRFAAQRTGFLVGESRRYALWKDVWSKRLLRYAPESKYLREPFEELELERFYKNAKWFHCLGMLLFLRDRVEALFSSEDS